MLAGRTLLIATKHKKEEVIAPVLKRETGVRPIVSQHFDTDVFGTFTGETERIKDALSTARAKCYKAMESSGCDLAIASEGSFGAHPSAFFIPADEEILLLIDRKNNLEIAVRELSIHTNFAGQEIKTETALRQFAQKVKFPSHAIILRLAKDNSSHIQKDITNWPQLLAAYHQLRKLSHSVYAETDMRAMYNPSRMKVIENAARKLALKINSCCPACRTPGFGVTHSLRGLPCSACSYPTQSTLSLVSACGKCHFKQEDKYPRGKKFEDPCYCELCNP
jgi:hypothetical protein